MREFKADTIVSIKEDIDFVTEKMRLIRESSKGYAYLDIKQMADFHRYSETRMFLTATLTSLESDGI